MDEEAPVHTEEPHAEPSKVESKHAEPKETMLSRIRRGKQSLVRTYIECRRVLRITKKPDKETFIGIVKVSGIGMAIVGIIGFLIHILEFFILK